MELRVGMRNLAVAEKVHTTALPHFNAWMIGVLRTALQISGDRGTGEKVGKGRA